MRGKRGRGAEKNTCVRYVKAKWLRLYASGEHCSAKELLPIIKDFSELKESEIYSDGLKLYGALVDFLLRFVLQLCKKEQRLITE